jgi:hypothetical protein
MYEGKPPQSEGEVSLQAVSWADLSSRLSAARDLRKALANGGNSGGGEGSFDAVSARWIADHATEHGVEHWAEHGADDIEGKLDVNHDDLGNLKAADPMAGLERALPMHGERLGDRGKE